MDCLLEESVVPITPANQPAASPPDPDLQDALRHVAWIRSLVLRQMAHTANSTADFSPVPRCILPELATEERPAADEILDLLAALLEQLHAVLKVEDRDASTPHADSPRTVYLQTVERIEGMLSGTSSLLWIVWHLREGKNVHGILQDATADRSV